MKCSRIQRHVLSIDPTHLADPIRDHLNQCPECARQVEQLGNIRRLLALKQYERPDPEAVNRCIVHVRRQIAWVRWNAEQQEFEEGPSIGVPWIRLGLAAAFLLFLGIHGGTINNMPAEQSSVIQADASAVDFGEWLARNRNPRPSTLRPASSFEMSPTLDTVVWSNRTSQNSAGPRIHWAVE